MVSTVPYKSFRFILINNCAHIASREVGFKQIIKTDSKTSLAATCVMILDKLWWRYSNMKQHDKQCLYLFFLHNWAHLVSWCVPKQTWFRTQNVKDTYKANVQKHTGNWNYLCSSVMHYVIWKFKQIKKTRAILKLFLIGVQLTLLHKHWPCVLTATIVVRVLS